MWGNGSRAFGAEKVFSCLCDRFLVAAQSYLLTCHWCIGASVLQHGNYNIYSKTHDFPLLELGDLLEAQASLAGVVTKVGVDRLPPGHLVTGTRPRNHRHHCLIRRLEWSCWLLHLTTNPGHLPVSEHDP